LYNASLGHEGILRQDLLNVNHGFRRSDRFLDEAIWSFGLHCQLGDFVQDHRKQAPRDRHFGQLERHVLRMPHDFGAVKFQLHGGIKLESQTPLALDVFSYYLILLKT
jgi:hypothetical protein